MKLKVIIILIALLISCKKDNDKKNTSNNQLKSDRMKQIINNSETLISDVALVKNNLFDENDIDINKYKYNNIFIENIKITNLLDSKYRIDFFNYLTKYENEDDEFKSSLFTQLLMLKIFQHDHEAAFFLLNETSKNSSISYNGIELYNQSLWKLFLKKPLFFIKESSKINDDHLIKYIINDISREFLMTYKEITEPLRQCTCYEIKPGMILLKKEQLDSSYLASFKNKFKNQPVIEFHCSPTLENGWNSVTEEYYDIKSMIDQDLENKLSLKEKLFYKNILVPILKDYITK